MTFKNESVSPAFELEEERYEIGELPRYRFEVVRRDFFKLLGGGVAVCALVDSIVGQESGGGGPRGAQRAPQEIAAWLHIGEDGVVTVYTGKTEVGQNIRTSLAQAVADELSTPIDSIRLVMADTQLTPFDIGTFGSLTTPQMAPQLRKAAAAAREVLLARAAELAQADAASLAVADGKVTHSPSGRTFTFGQLTKGQKLMTAISPSATPLPVANWKLSGKRVLKTNGRDIVTGTHKHTTDLKLPGMLVGKVLRAPALNSTLTGVDLGAAEKIAGVTVVRDGDFLGVTAKDELTATRAVAAIRAQWQTSPQPSHRELYEYLKKTNPEAATRSRSDFSRGSLEEGTRTAQHKLQATYNIAYIAHAPLEPRAAIAEWKDGKLTVWTGTQRPFGVRGELAQTFRIAEDLVRVIVPDTGSAYGGKHTGDAAIEAARLAKAAGKPVRLVWTREEEFTWAYFRPAGVIDITSAVQSDGTITAWEFHNYNSGASAIRTLYDIPNQKIEFHTVRSPLRQGSYRGLAATANHFARESHMDELARQVKVDSLEFRLKNLKDTRLRNVLEAAAKAFGWGKSKPSAGRGYGIAGGSEKGSYVANCVEVSVKADKVKIERVVTAFECGAVVNPDGLRNQVEGAVIQGIGGALFEAIEFENGKILNPHFSRYRVPRFSDLPVLETVLLDRRDLPSVGAGETPIVTLAPAVGNAIFDATGIRIRSLPMAPGGLKA